MSKASSSLSSRIEELSESSQPSSDSSSVDVEVSVSEWMAFSRFSRDSLSSALACLISSSKSKEQSLLSLRRSLLSYLVASVVPTLLPCLLIYIGIDRYRSR